MCLQLHHSNLPKSLHCREMLSKSRQVVGECAAHLRGGASGVLHKSNPARASLFRLQAVQQRWMSGVPSVTMQDVEQIVKDETPLIIDVRGAHEVAATGLIGHAKNVPLPVRRTG